MAERFYQVNHKSITLIKIMYYYAKVFGMTCSTITKSNRVKYSKKIHISSVALKLVCYLGFAYHLPAIIEEVLAIQETYLRALTFIQISSFLVFGLVLLTYQTSCHEQFVSIVNRSIEILLRISVITKNPKIFALDFYILVLIRIGCSVCTVLGDVPRAYIAFIQHDYKFVGENLFSFVLLFGILIMVDTLCLGCIISSVMYGNMGRHMVAFAKRIEKEHGRMNIKVLSSFAKELDECSLIYSEIYKITLGIHSLFQFNVLFKFYIDLVITIGFVHQNFLSYITRGVVIWPLVILTMLRITDFIYLVMVIDMTTRRSQIPGYIHLEGLCSDIDSRWDRSVDNFLAQQRFEELKIDVFGLFQLNNELCLRAFSVLITYLTILIEFSMMGNFQKQGLLSHYNDSRAQYTF